MNIFRSFVFSYYISVAGAWSAVPLCELGPAVVLLLSVCVAEEQVCHGLLQSVYLVYFYSFSSSLSVWSI